MFFLSGGLAGEQDKTFFLSLTQSDPLKATHTEKLNWQNYQRKKVCKSLWNCKNWQTVCQIRPKLTKRKWRKNIDINLWSHNVHTFLRPISESKRKHDEVKSFSTSERKFDGWGVNSSSRPGVLCAISYVLCLFPKCKNREAETATS